MTKNHWMILSRILQKIMRPLRYLHKSKAQNLICKYKCWTTWFLLCYLRCHLFHSVAIHTRLPLTFHSSRSLVPNHSCSLLYPSLGISTLPNIRYKLICRIESFHMSCYLRCMMFKETQELIWSRAMIAMGIVKCSLWFKLKRITAWTYRLSPWLTNQGSKSWNGELI